MKRILSILVCCLLFTTAYPIVNAADTAESSETDSYTYTNIEKLPDGGTIYTLNIDGIENEFPIPPDGFNPLEATNEQLETYGFPPRPQESDMVQNWTDLMSNYTGMSLPIINVEERDSSASLQPATKGTELEAFASDNWSGYLANGRKSEYSQVQGDYVVPDASLSSVQGMVSSWIGLGGVNGVTNHKQLVQCGTDAVKATNGVFYNAWYQCLGKNNRNNAVYLENLAVHPGDKIHLYLAFETANNKINFYLANNTTGKSQSVLIDAAASEYYDGTTVEWVDERPTITENGISRLAPLLDYGSIPWSNCQAYHKGKWVSLSLHDDIGFQRIVMVNGDKEWISYPDPTPEGAFTDYWYAAK